MIRTTSEFVGRCRKTCSALTLAAWTVCLAPVASAQSYEADILFAIDTTGSMTGEIAAFEASINNAVAILGDAGIDFRIVVVANSAVCVPPPLGTGNCPGDSTGLYLHVDETVDSNNALDRVLATKAHWEGFMRDGSNRTIVVLSDDNSFVTAEDFQNAILIDPQFDGYKFHGIVDTSGCNIIGGEYIELASLTGGTTYDICGVYGEAGIGLALQEIFGIVVGDVMAPPPPAPEGICKDAANAAIGASSTYTKAARVVRRLCDEDSQSCDTALINLGAAYSELQAADSELVAVCP